jgi:hypothetical protein
MINGNQGGAGLTWNRFQRSPDEIDHSTGKCTSSMDKKFGSVVLILIFLRVSHCIDQGKIANSLLRSKKKGKCNTKWQQKGSEPRTHPLSEQGKVRLHRYICLWWASERKPGKKPVTKPKKR